jgi:hypothetical protein
VRAGACNVTTCRSCSSSSTLEHSFFFPSFGTTDAALLTFSGQLFASAAFMAFHFLNAQKIVCSQQRKNHPRFEPTQWNTLFPGSC